MGMHREDGSPPLLRLFLEMYACLVEQTDLECTSGEVHLMIDASHNRQN